MLTILHASDFHLDSPFTGLSPEKGAIRRRELRQLPGRLADLVRERRADLVLLPGDLFDGDRVHPETIDLLTQALRDMAVPVFISPGNHDYYHSRSPYAAAPWPDNVHIFTEADLRPVELPELNCVVHGCAFTSPHREDDPLASFTAPVDGSTHLVCVHGSVGPLGSYAPIPPQTLANCGADYVALGHIHSCSGLQRAGMAHWAYSGCPEGRGFDECGEKGVLLVTMDGDQVSAEFIPTCSRQYRIEPLELGEGRLPDFPTGSPDLVRLLLRGEQARPPQLTALGRLWEDRFFHLELRDETTLPQQLWARAEEDSLTGLFLRQMKERLDQASEDERPQLLLCARFGLAALEGGEDIRP